MKLLKVIFHNYRVYAGRQEISLAASTPEKPVVLVGGLNGEGKTTLLEGIQLGLFGRRSDVWRHEGSGYAEYLQLSIHRGADQGAGAMVQVEFVASDDNGPRHYKVQRTWSLNGGGKVAEYVQVFIDGELDRHYSETWGDQVERFIPARLAGLLFFDGEKIKHYAKSQSSRELIERGMLSLLGVDLLDQLDIDLRALETRIARSRKAAAKDEDLIRLEEELDVKTTDLETLRETIASLSSRYDAKKRECEKADIEFERAGGRLFEKRRELEAERQRLIEQHKGVKSQLIALSAGSMPLSMVTGLLSRCAVQMQVEINVLGSRVALERFEAHYDRLQALLAARKPGEKIRRLLDEFYQDEFKELRSIASMETYLEPSEVDYVSVVGLLETMLPNEQGKASELLDFLNELDSQLEDADRKLAAVPDSEALAEIQQRRDTQWHDLAVLQGRIEQLAEDKRLAEHHLSETEASLHKRIIKVFGETNEEADKARVLEHAELVRKTLSVFRERLIKKRIAQLEQIILESYRHLMRKAAMVAEMRIDPGTFDLSLYDTKGGLIKPDWLSAGERQLLVVSILWGFARASGCSLPVIVDTPLGRLDSQHRENLVRHYFPHASHQVILLSTDEEIVGTTLSRLKPAISCQYRLTYDEVSDSTRIEVGYFEERAHAN